jgi:DNA polymerase III epsilon subunit-like protein
MNAPSATDVEWSQARLAVVDVEGNGAHPLDLVELAVVLIINGTPEPAQTWLVHPANPISWIARNVHGITNADVADAPTVADIQDDVLSALADVHVVVGHQVRVDLDVLGRSLPSWSPPAALDTLRLARAQYPDLPAHRLGALAETLHLNADPTQGQAHRAGYDATLTARLLLHLAESLPQPATLADLLQRGSWPPTQPGAGDQQQELDLTNT